MNKAEVIGLISARGGSKRIPHKNIALLGGQPLIAYTIRSALAARHLTRVVVSTDDREIVEVSQALGAEIIFPRPPELATDTASSVEVLRHGVLTLEAGGKPVDVAVLLQPTSPFRTGEHIDAAIDLFFASRADTVTAVRAVTEHPYYQWRPEGRHILPLYTLDHQALGRSQLPLYYIENGSIYILRRSALFNEGLYGSQIVPFVMGALESVDIDDPLDLAWAEFLLGRQEVERRIGCE